MPEPVIVAGALPKREVVGIGVTLGTFEQHLDAIVALAHARTSSYVCCVNAHMAVEASSDKVFARLVNAADIATADGVPLLRTLQKLGRTPQERVAGNDLMPALFARAAEHGLRVFLYGGKPEVLEVIQQKAFVEFPGLRFAGAYSPPFRTLTDEELLADAGLINSSGAAIVMVSLGCPKQERWMASMRPEVNAVMLGLGGAFLLYAEVDTRAPKWMRDLSLEWAYRLVLEPRRLWKRYLVTNTLFLGLVARYAWQRLKALPVLVVPARAPSTVPPRP